MLLLGVLAALLAAGLWMYALIDILLTPATDCRRMSKGAWLAVAGFLFVPGALAWLALGRPFLTPGRYIPGRVHRSPWLYRPRIDLLGPDAEAALRRHPAGRARYDMDDEPDFLDMADAVPAPAWPTGPDDDPEFLSYLDRVVRDIREAGNGA
jgi:Phospholipase_D-nuclease N-terminal